MGRLKAMTGQDTFAQAVTKNYAYDRRGQLAQAKLSFQTGPEDVFRQTNRYTYNAAGEITAINATPYRYERSASGAIVSITVGENFYNYDTFGNLAATDKLNAIHWNPQGHISSVESRNGDTIQYTYQPDKNRFTEQIKRDNKERSTVF